MTVTEVKQALGSWDLQLHPGTPQSVLSALTYFGHIVLIPGRVTPTQFGDNLLSVARYVGVYLNRADNDTHAMHGVGMSYWLGDDNEKGDVFETAVTITSQTFANSIRALLPAGGAITEGTLYSGVTGTYTGSHQWTTPRTAITYVTDTFGAEWRVNNNGTLDAGLVSSLYVTTPKALLLRKGMDADTGADLMRRAFAGQMTMDTNVEDLTTRVVLLAQGEGSNITVAAAASAPTAYKDIHGNPIKATRMVSESGTESVNASTRAQLALNQFTNARQSADLSTSEYDVKGTFVVGDYIDVYDPANGFVDTNREVSWQGQPINPMSLRCAQMSWPIPAGWTVAFRDINGVWTDLTTYYVPQTGDTTITVGAINRYLSDTNGEPVSFRTNISAGSGGGDAAIPAAPAFTGFSSGAYQSGSTTKSAIRAQWSTPLNVDSSTITDGDHYEIQYRVNANIGYTVPWDTLSTYSWDSLNTWDALITAPVVVSPQWQTAFVGWGTNAFTISELTPGVRYELQIRAVDGATPPNQSAWSASSYVDTMGDLVAPSTPAAPLVAASRISLQVTHNLGKASGGTFNLEQDLDRLDVHMGGSSSFFCDATNKIGQLIATTGMLQASIPAVGTFQVDNTTNVWIKVVAVDRAGNKSSASDGVQATILLIDDAHISDLTVSKVTAGTINAGWILAGSIKTGTSGARVEMDNAGIRTYDPSGNQTLGADATSGNVVVTGDLGTNIDGAGIRLIPGAVPRVRMKPNVTDPNEGQIYSMVFAGGAAIETSIRDSATNGINGGKTLLTRDMAILSHQPASGLEQFIGINYPYTGIAGQGKIVSGFGGANDLWYSYRNDIGAGFGSVGLTFGATMAATVSPIYSITSATGVVTHTITAYSGTGYTVSWSGTAAHTIFEWVIRC